MNRTIGIDWTHLKDEPYLHKPKCAYLETRANICTPFLQHRLNFEDNFFPDKGRFRSEPRWTRLDRRRWRSWWSWRTCRSRRCGRGSHSSRGWQIEPEKSKKNNELVMKTKTLLRCLCLRIRISPYHKKSITGLGKKLSYKNIVALVLMWLRN